MKGVKQLSEKKEEYYIINSTISQADGIRCKNKTFEEKKKSSVRLSFYFLPQSFAVHFVKHRGRVRRTREGAVKAASPLYPFQMLARLGGAGACRTGGWI